MSASAQSKALLLLDHGVSGMIRVALSLRLGGWMRSFRHCLAQEVLSTLSIQQGHTTPEAAGFRRKAVTVFCGAGARRRQVQSILVVVAKW